MKTEERMQPWIDDVRSQTISGAEGSDSCSLASSGYGSSSEADIWSITGSSHSKDSSLINRFKSGFLKILNSMELTPPLMSGHERSNTSSMGSSAYGSFRSKAEANIRKLYYTTAFVQQFNRVLFVSHSSKNMDTSPGLEHMFLQSSKVLSVRADDVKLLFDDLSDQLLVLRQCDIPNIQRW
ncbi:hypothetical protein Q8A67_025066 [Cirrhinus molitorella]|uniref:Uncharacterized protein n=1 Tax=Cirrhinus molitorella TaxID=172907 RepID=A0AA88NZ34_9TELE|nr:hypothetical protein Q8A67_025066 [Cirrhinus molitorella]